jgi:hypothetical protein
MGGSLILSTISAALLILFELNSSDIWPDILITVPPGIAAVGERLIYGIPEDSESCFKNLKPWKISTAYDSKV